jgi:hypothetical protein
MKFALALAASLAVAGLATPSSAQVLTVAQVTSACPDVSRAQACPPLATQFLSGRYYGASTDQEIVSLVVAIAEASQQSNVSRRACLNAADGIRILAGGVSTAEQSKQITDIADALCAGNRTASTGRPGTGGNSGFSFSVPESLSEKSDGGGTIIIADNGNDQDDDEEETDDGPGTTTGALGNNHVGGTNPVALAHASTVAQSDPGVGSDGVAGGTGGGADGTTGKPETTGKPPKTPKP